MNTQFYKIEALTNMHVGSGDSNYGIIDNQIQRDAVTTLPNINGSSLKGALREFFENEWSKKDSKLISIFGDNGQDAGYRFLAANLLAIPVRSNKKAYFLATAPMVLEQLKENTKNFGGNLDLSAFDNLTPKDGNPIVFTETDGLIIEDFEKEFVKKDNTGTTILGDFENLVIFSDNDFKKLCDDTSLPVIARNRTGEDKNLWYEQVLPHKSLLSFVVIYNKDNNFEEFDKELTNGLVHIGANATVGYGFTKISKL